MNQTEDKVSTVDRIKAADGPVAVAGIVYSPYDGCHYQTVVGFVKDDLVYLSEPWSPRMVNSWLKQRMKDCKLDMNIQGETFSPPCISLEDVDEVFSPSSGTSELEVIPSTEVEDYVDYSDWGYVLELVELLDLPRPKGFKCRECEKDLENYEDVKYYKGEYQGNGGIGVLAPRPTCQECYNLRTCGYCGEEWPDGHNYDMSRILYMDEEGHCAACVPARACKTCGVELKPGWQAKEEELDRFEKRVCEECESWQDLHEYKLVCEDSEWEAAKVVLKDLEWVLELNLAGRTITTRAPKWVVTDALSVTDVVEQLVEVEHKGTDSLFPGLEIPAKVFRYMRRDSEHIRSHEYESFTVWMPQTAVDQCHHRGSCDRDVDSWAEHIERDPRCTPEALREELREHGAWEEKELQDDADNWKRILWLTAGAIQDEDRDNES
jgi:hypothetical protein